MSDEVKKNEIPLKTAITQTNFTKNLTIINQYKF